LNQYPGHSQEINQEKSFDVLASVDLYRYDLQNFGQIRRETHQRVYDEELSYIAEGINQPLATEFRLRRVGDELVYFHNGQWRPYLASLTNAVDVYIQESKVDSRRMFMYQRAAEDLRVGYQLADLSPGQKLRWQSSFPDQELQRYGADFIGELGFQVERQMGFLYEAESNADGTLTLRTYSVDNSDQEAFAAALSAPDMRAGYDAKMSQKFGGDFRAGRRLGDNLSEENAWDTVRAYRDLIEDHFLKGIENLARSDHLSRAELETEKKRLTYGVWKALRNRLEQNTLLSDEAGDNYAYGYGSVQEEVSAAYIEAAEHGEVLFGCGGAIRGEAAILQASPRDVLRSIFGRGEKINMTCPFCGATQHGDPCAASIQCSECEAKIEDGVVLSRGKGPKKARQKVAKKPPEPGLQNAKHAQLEQIRRTKIAASNEPPRLKILI